MIRKYLTKDLDEVVTLFAQLWDHKKVNENIIKGIIKKDKSKYYYVYENKCKIIGVIVYSLRLHLWAEGKVLEIEAFVINKKDRNKGYGNEMIKYVENIARKEKCKSMEFNSAFRRKRAHQFYLKNGYNKCAYVFETKLIQNQIKFIMQ